MRYLKQGNVIARIRDSQYENVEFYRIRKDGQKVHTFCVADIPSVHILVSRIKDITDKIKKRKWKRIKPQSVHSGEKVHNEGPKGGKG